MIWFWSDLSGVGKAGLRVFGELYQLLFHLGSVGVINAAAAAAFFRGKKGVAEKWDAFTEAQRVVAGVLALHLEIPASEGFSFLDNGCGCSRGASSEATLS